MSDDTEMWNRFRVRQARRPASPVKWPEWNGYAETPEGFVEEMDIDGDFRPGDRVWPSFSWRLADRAVVDIAAWLLHRLRLTRSRSDTARVFSVTRETARRMVKRGESYAWERFPSMRSAIVRDRVGRNP